MKVAVEYSFHLGRGGDTHDVVIPAARLLNVPLDISVIRHLVEQDEALLAELFRDRLPEYLLMTKDAAYWSEELQREGEAIRLIEVI